MNSPTYRQYIGARYVPKFFENSATGDATWASGTEYEPLTIVTWNLNCYTSKKLVPASVGQPNTNPDYWVNTGNYNAYIQEIEERVSDAESDITGLEGSVDGLDDRLTTAEGKIETAEDDIDTLEGNVSDLETAVHNVETAVKKKYIFIGDSYGHASGTNNGWIDKLISMMGLTSSVDYYESGVGGASFGGQNTNFIHQIQAIYNAIDDPERITDIVVIGGTNELGYDVEDILSGINAFTTYCKTNFPNAKVSLGCVYGTTDATKVVAHYGRALRAYSSARGVKFLNNLQYVLVDRSLLNSDGIHPTDNGYTVLTNAIYDAILDGYNCAYFKMTTPEYDEGTTASIHNSKIYIYLNNDLMTVGSTDRIGIVPTSGTFTLEFNTVYKICNLNNPLFVGGSVSGSESPFVTTTRALIHTTSNGYYSIMCVAMLINKCLYIISTDRQIGTQPGFNQIDDIQIDKISITGPACCA